MPITPTPGVTESRLATPEELNVLPADTRLGEPEFDAIVDAVLGGDVDSVMSAVAWEMRECAATPLGLPSPPRCVDGEVDGTSVPAIIWISGEGSWLRPEDLRANLELVLAERRPLCGLVRGADGSRAITLRQALLWTAVEGGTSTDAALVRDFFVQVVDGTIVLLGNNGSVTVQSEIACYGVRSSR